MSHRLFMTSRITTSTNRALPYATNEGIQIRIKKVDKMGLSRGS